MSDDLRLRVLFMGTPEFAVPVLTALLHAGYDIVGVYSQPDRPAGRGGRVAASPVKSHATQRGLPVFQPASLSRDEGARQELAGLAPDLIVVAAYGLLLPPDTLAVPRLGSLNIHPSMLPLYRGPSPVSTAVLDGVSATGVTVMEMDEGMDTGPVVAQRETLIGPDETAEELTSRLFDLGGSLLVELLPRWASGEVRAVPQDDSRATVTRRLTRGDGEIDWGRTSAYLSRQVRAYHPWPGSFTHWRGRRLKVIEASDTGLGWEISATPGRVVSLDEGMGACTGDGVLELKRVQLEGKGATDGRDFVQGYSEIVGSTFLRELGR